MTAFQFADVQGELTAMKRMADTLLESTRPIDQAISLLDQIKSARRESRWEVLASDPIRTVPTKGYLSSGKGAYWVVAEVDFAWDVSPIIPKRGPVADFALAGIASTRATVRLNDDEHTILAMFRMEIGDAQSPGTHFHSQILGQDGWAGEGNEHLDHVFPSWLKVPRIPFPVATPAFALEFCLAELFQDNYTRALTRRQGDVQRWQSIQRRRFERLFAWQLQTLKNTSGSPWLALKSAKPVHDLFTH